MPFKHAPDIVRNSSSDCLSLNYFLFSCNYMVKIMNYFDMFQTYTSMVWMHYFNITIFTTVFERKFPIFEIIKLNNYKHIHSGQR